MKWKLLIRISFFLFLREDVKKNKNLLAIDDTNETMNPIPPHCNLNYATKFGFILGKHVVGVLFISRSKFKIDAVTVYIYMMFFFLTCIYIYDVDKRWSSYSSGFQINPL